MSVSWNSSLIPSFISHLILCCSPLSSVSQKQWQWHWSLVQSDLCTHSSDLPWGPECVGLDPFSLGRTCLRKPVLGSCHLEQSRPAPALGKDMWFIHFEESHWSTVCWFVGFCFVGPNEDQLSISVAALSLSSLFFFLSLSFSLSLSYSFSLSLFLSRSLFFPNVYLTVLSLSTLSCFLFFSFASSSFSLSRSLSLVATCFRGRNIRKTMRSQLVFVLKMRWKQARSSWASWDFCTYRAQME